MPYKYPKLSTIMHSAAACSWKRLSWTSRVLCRGSGPCSVWSSCCSCAPSCRRSRQCRWRPFRCAWCGRGARWIWRSRRTAGRDCRAWTVSRWGPLRGRRRSSSWPGARSRRLRAWSGCRGLCLVDGRQSCARGGWRCAEMGNCY